MENNENALISVIVPIYNVEAYIKKCIDSILNQTYKNIELILVDDGSPDSCGEICDNYAEKDDRVRVIHKENGGQGSARNRGLDIAKGEYIAFVDSDDWLKPDMYESLLCNLLAYKADLAVCGFFEVENAFTSEYYTSDTILEMDNYQLIRAYYSDMYIATAPWNKLYRKELWENMRFPEKTFREDQFVMYKVLLKAKKTVHIGKAKYFYNIRDGSSEHSKFSKKFLVSCEAIDEQAEYVRKIYPELANVLHDKRIDVRLNIVRDMIFGKAVKKNKSIFNEQIKFLKKNRFFDAERNKIRRQIIILRSNYVKAIKIKSIFRTAVNRIKGLFYEK